MELCPKKGMIPQFLIVKPHNFLVLAPYHPSHPRFFYALPTWFICLSFLPVWFLRGAQLPNVLDDRGIRFCVQLTKWLSIGSCVRSGQRRVTVSRMTRRGRHTPPRTHGWVTAMERPIKDEGRLWHKTNNGNRRVLQRVLGIGADGGQTTE